MAIGIVLAGTLSDRTNPRRILMAGCLGTIAAGFLLAPMMGGGSLFLLFLFLSLALLLMGFVYGPLGAWLPGLFPAQVRYTGASIAFNGGGILGGALGADPGAGAADRGGLALVGLYLSVAASISFVALATLGQGPPGILRISALRDPPPGRLRQGTARRQQRSIGEQLAHLDDRHRLAEMPALPLVDLEAFQPLPDRRRLDPLGSDGQAQLSPSFAMALTIAALSESSLIESTKLLSILIRSKGSARRWARLE